MRHLRTVGLLRLTTLFAILLWVSFVSAQQTPEVIVSYPPGALAFFPRSVNEDVSKVRKVYLQAEPGRATWVIDATPVFVPGLSGDGSLKVEKAIGFFVPQLPKGRYVAWYQTAAGQIRQSITFEIVPQLLSEVGITRGAPDADVEVAIKIYSPNVARRDEATPRVVTAEITLSSVDPRIADLAQNQAPTVSTNREGIATWRIHIKQPGIVPFTATAKGFESTTLAVVGMPADAPTYLEAAVLATEMRAQRLELAARQASESVEKLNEARDAQIDKMAGNREEAARANRTSAQLKARIDALNREAVARNAEAAATRMELENLQAQKAAQPGSLSENDLQPGDILLVRGTTPIVSQAITAFETGELKSAAQYSHASIYLGKVNGVGQVAEMLLNGFYVSSLKDSTRSDLLVDVFRWESISQQKREEIARRASLPYGPGVGSGSPIPYAVSQISVLAYVAAMRFPLLGRFILNSDVKALVAVADEFAGGRRKMICSELVAWIYRDAGLDLTVTHWKRFSDLKLLTTEDRRKDYTTPNMLAASRSLRQVGRYLGP